jgi:hypothetical protein
MARTWQVSEQGLVGTPPLVVKKSLLHNQTCWSTKKSEATASRLPVGADILDVVGFCPMKPFGEGEGVQRGLVEFLLKFLKFEH